MRFKQFLSEQKDFHKFQDLEEICAAIKNDCSQFLRESQSVPLFRGIKGSFLKTTNGFFYSPTPRDRSSLDSGFDLNFILDSSFDYNFGIKELRKNCFFGSGDAEQAEDYGSVCYIFPTDGYSAVWSDYIKDAYSKEDDIYAKIVKYILEYGYEGQIHVNAVRHIASILGRMVGSTKWAEFTNGDRIGTSLLEDPYVKEAFSRFITDEYDLKSLVKIFSTAIKNLGKDVYEQDNLPKALRSENEIMFTDCDGYYVIKRSEIFSHSELTNYASLIKKIERI